MERALPDARLGTQASSPQASSSSSSRGGSTLFPSSTTRERTLSSTPGLASFPHEDIESIRSFPLASSASTSGAGTSCASSSAAGFRAGSFPRWTAAPLTPKFFAATSHHPPPPLETLLTSSNIGGGTSTSTTCAETEAVESDERNHYYYYSNGFSATAASTAMEETEQREQSGSSLGGLSTVLASEGTSDGSNMTMSAPLAALPLPITRPMVIPPAPSPAVVADSMVVAPTRKRKRIPGAMRMRNFLCMHPGCGKSFTDNAHLRDHTVVHTGEKKLSCPTCHKLFARASTLQEHVRVHTGEKPYVCGVPGCEKRYSSRAAMRFHRSTHAPPLAFTTEPHLHKNGSIQALIDANALHVPSSEVSPFVCQECGKHFRVRDLLMAHLKVHATHTTSALTSSQKPPGSTRITFEPPKQSVEEETGASHMQIGDGESCSGSGFPPSFDESRHFQNTIRAQQDEIEQLKAEILRLRGRSSSKSARSAAPTQGAENLQPALTAPVEMLQDGYKPFECCICHNRFSNFYQLTFHGKQHPETPMTEVTGGQTPLPVGPKHCPEEHCEYAKSTGRSLRNLQTLKRHWQRRHQTARPYACSYCPAARQKTFKTRENLKAHEKDCTRTTLCAEFVFN